MKGIIVLYVLLGFAATTLPQISNPLGDLGVPAAAITVMSVVFTGLVSVVGTLALAFGVKELPLLPKSKDETTA